MPKSTLMGLRWVLAPAAAFVAAAACCPPAGAVVGGRSVTNIAADAPYQVGVVVNRSPWQSIWCGGVVRDATHIATAAHCVFDNALGSSGQPIPTSAVQVVAGKANIKLSGGQRQGVQSISLDSEYDPSTFSHDAAVLTLVGSLGLGSGQGVEAIQPADDDTWDTVALGSPLRVTGWGQTNGSDPGSYPGPLQLAGEAAHPLPYVSDAACGPSYAGFDAPEMLCAGSSTVDSCFGDSGGPLTVEDSNFPGVQRLVGLVSFGPSNG